MAISMLKIRRPLGRLIFNMGIAIPGKTVFLIETAPCFWCQSPYMIVRYCLQLVSCKVTTSFGIILEKIDPYLYIRCHYHLMSKQRPISQLFFSPPNLNSMEIIPYCVYIHGHQMSIHFHMICRHCATVMVWVKFCIDHLDSFWIWAR